MSLSSWFRDYVYIPLGGNRLSAGRTYFNLAAVFLLCGLWHGASWNFVIWGALHGLFLVLERAFLGRPLAALPRPIQHGYTLLLVCIGWVFFRAPDVHTAGNFLRAMTGAAGASPPGYAVSLFVTPAVQLTAFAALIFVAPLVPYMLSSSTHEGRARRWLGVPMAALLFVLCASHLASTSYNPFIYFRF
jgi:alginate O-acetyltransferase complex protein AlgI